MKSDWKYWLVILLTTIGILVPVAMSQFNLKGKSISLSLISNAELVINRKINMPEIRISIDGQIINSPSLTIFEIENNGTKPILASDFVNPLKIILEKGSKVIHANVQDRSPYDLPVQIDIGDQYVKIFPLLLNPTDRIRLSIFTSGERPSFSPTARIVGINSIDFENKSDSETSLFRIVKNALLGVLGGTLYFLFGSYFFKSKTVTLNRTIIVVSMIGFAFLSVGRFNQLNSQLFTENHRVGYAAMLSGMMVLGCLILIYGLMKEMKNKN